MKVFVVKSPFENFIDSVWSTCADAETRKRDLDNDSNTDEWCLEEYEVDGDPTTGGARTPGPAELWTRAAEQFAEKHGGHGAIMKLIPNKDICRGCGAMLTMEQAGGSYVPVERRAEPVLDRDDVPEGSNDPDDAN